MGLTARLRGATGGVEKKLSDASLPGDGPASGTGGRASNRDSLKIVSSGSRKAGFAPDEVEVERDAKGAITRIIQPEEAPSALKRKRRNPLNDPLNELSESEPSEDEGARREAAASIAANGEVVDDRGIVPQLEAIARRIPVKVIKKPTAAEQEWIERLVAKHGDDYRKMFWDRRLNPLQRTENDIRRRVERWRSQQGLEASSSRLSR